MLATPIRWVTASAQDRLAGAVQEAMEAWASSWGLQAPVLVSTEALTMTEAAEAWPGMKPLNDAASGAAFFRVDPRHPLAWVEMLLGDGSGGGSALADDVARQAEQAVVGALARAVVPLERLGQAGRDPASGVPGHWGVMLRWRCGAVAGAVAVAWDALHAKGWLNMPVGGGLPGWLPEAALAGLPTRLTAVLCEAEVPVSELADLDIGDVLMLDHRLDQAMVLRADDCSLAVHAHLVGDKGHRAIQVVASRHGGQE